MMTEVYQGLYKYIRDDMHDDVIEIEIEIVIEIGCWDTQVLQSQIYLIRELELNK